MFRIVVLRYLPILTSPLPLVHLLLLLALQPSPLEPYPGLDPCDGLLLLLSNHHLVNVPSPLAPLTALNNNGRRGLPLLDAFIPQQVDPLPIEFSPHHRLQLNGRRFHI